MKRLPRPTGTALVPATSRDVAPYKPGPVKLSHPMLQTAIKRVPMLGTAMEHAGLIRMVPPEELKARGICMPSKGEGDEECEGCWALMLVIIVTVALGFYFGWSVGP